MSKGKAFFSTLPGVVSGIAALVTGIVGLGTLAVQLGWVGDDDGGGNGGGAATTVATEAGGSGSGGAPSGGAAELEATPAKLTFVPLQAKEMTVTVRNDGTAPVTLRPPDIDGADSDQYSAAYDRCESPLGAGRSCRVKVTFEPTKAGRSTATLVVAPTSGSVKAVEVEIEGNHLL